MKLPPNLAKKVLELAGERTASAVEVPIPPSANNLFNDFIHPKLKRKMRVPTREYLDWQAIAAPIVRRLRSPLRYPCELVFTIIGKVNESRDGGNLDKALCDALVKNGVITDDNLRHVRKGTWEYRPDLGRDDYVRVEIREAERTGVEAVDGKVA